METKKEKINSEHKKIAWHQNFKWWHITLISLFSAGLYLVTKIVIFDYIFLVGFVYSIVLAFKKKT